MSESSQGHIAPVTAGLGLVVGLLVATAFPQVLVAQSPVTPPATQPPGTLPATPQPFEQPDLPGQLLNGSGMQSFGLQGGGQGGIDEFTSIWSRPTPPQFSGFPSFPSTLPGYGNYPLPSNQATGNPMSLVLPPAVAGPPGWPAWVRSEARKPLPFGMTTGLLIGQEGRVWHSDAKDEPFVPIRFHDKFAALTVGATIETRGAGAFELLLETTTRVETRGATAMKTLTLDDETVHLQVDKLTWLRITATSRTNRVTLPDGSVLEMNTSSAGGAPSAAGV